MLCWIQSLSTKVQRILTSRHSEIQLLYRHVKLRYFQSFSVQQRFAGKSDVQILYVRFARIINLFWIGSVLLSTSYKCSLPPTTLLGFVLQSDRWAHTPDCSWIKLIARRTPGAHFSDPNGFSVHGVWLNLVPSENENGGRVEVRPLAPGIPFYRSVPVVLDYLPFWPKP